MKYFTPALLQRFGSPNDDIADAAQAEWEEASTRYAAGLRAIKKHMPRRLRELLRRFWFHDARLFVGVVDGQVLRLSVQLDAPPRDTVTLRYQLAGPLKMVRHEMDLNDRPPYLVWLYDEIELVKPAAVPVFRQSILFNNGLELSVRFRKIGFSVAEALVLNGSAVEELAASKL